MTTKPIPDALVFRETPDGKDWFVRQIPAHRLAAFLGGGWKLLLDSRDVQSDSIEDVRQADEDKWKRKP